MIWNLQEIWLNIYSRLNSHLLGKGAIMYRVEWLDDDGEKEAHQWIRTHYFDMDFEMPMVFYDGE